MHVKPLIGTRAVPGLSVADLENFQADVAEGRTAKTRQGRGGTTTGGVGVAGRTLGMLHTIFEQAAAGALSRPTRRAARVRWRATTSASADFRLRR